MVYGVCRIGHHTGGHLYAEYDPENIFFWHETNPATEQMRDATWNEKLVLTLIVLIIFFTGVYPQPLIDLTKEAVSVFVSR